MRSFSPIDYSRLRSIYSVVVAAAVAAAAVVAVVVVADRVIVSFVDHNRL